MLQTTPESVLAEVTKATQPQFKFVALALDHIAPVGAGVTELADAVVADRLALSKTHLMSAERLLRLRPPEVRGATSRAYYSLYHAARACIFHFRRGDFDQHADVVSKLPDDLPQVDTWRNRIKDAREQRNECDYSPYPKQGCTKAEASKVVQTAREFIDGVEAYLVARGWTAP